MCALPLRLLGSLCFGIALCTLLTGCQYAYPFEVSGEVRNGATGAPLVGIKVYSSHFNLEKFVPGEEKPAVVTGPDGSFTFSESVRDIDLQPEGTKWVVWFVKDGLKPQRADLRRVNRPSSAKTTTQVFVVVSMHEEVVQK